VLSNFSSTKLEKCENSPPKEQFWVESRGSRGCPKQVWAVFDFYEEHAVRVLKNKLARFRSWLAPKQKGGWIPCPVSPSPPKKTKKS
jgi:hypothetical protein